jgi:zona occludens toxin (predicted ATPase)
MNDDFEPSTKPRIPVRSANDPPPRDHHTGLPSLSGEVETGETTWTQRLVMFLRAMAVLAMIMGLYNWAQITGFLGGEDGAFEVQTTQWQSATVYFAVIELVAAVGLWLATPWGAVVWLTTIVSMAVVEIMFPSVYGGHFMVVLFAAVLLAAYLALAWMAARERPP